MPNKQKYRQFCHLEPSIPIFSKDWWLDAVCGEENWDVVLYIKKGNIIGTMPYYFKRKYGFTMIIMPKLTQTMGPWIKYPPQQKYNSRLSHEKEVMTALIENLPLFDHFSQNFNYSITNWLPFYWKGFLQTTRYTYLIENLRNLDEVLQRFKGNMRNKIRKAEKQVEVIDNLGIDEFFRINTLTFERQAITIPYSLDYIKKQDETLKFHNSRKIFFAIDKNNRIHSALYLIWDKMSSYVHMVGENPDLRKSGAGILLIWNAIKFTKEKLGLDKFDFEGSMIESVEEIRRSCGGVQKAYFQVTKTPSNVLRLYRSLSRIVK